MGGQVARGGARSADLRHLDVSPPILGVQLGEAAGWVGHRLEADGVDDMARERVAALLVGGEVVRAERLCAIIVLCAVRICVSVARRVGARLTCAWWWWRASKQLAHGIA